jgi:hypothetical protein
LLGDNAERHRIEIADLALNDLRNDAELDEARPEMKGFKISLNASIRVIPM